MSVQHEETSPAKEDFDSPIQKLDVNSLIYVFNYLPIVDLVKIERVCKTWQNIAKSSWSKLKKLNVYPEILGLKHDKELNEYIVEEVLKRCGKYLKEISSTYFDNDEIGYDCSFMIAKYCKNLKSIDCYKASAKGIQEL